VKEMENKNAIYKSDFKRGEGKKGVEKILKMTIYNF
jgi:hypothetical protein